MNYVEHKQHYSQVALSARSVTITQMKCVHYYNFVRRSVDGSPTPLSSMYGDNKWWPTLDTIEKSISKINTKQSRSYNIRMYHCISYLKFACVALNNSSLTFLDNTCHYHFYDIHRPSDIWIFLKIRNEGQETISWKSDHIRVYVHLLPSILTVFTDECCFYLFVIGECCCSLLVVMKAVVLSSQS